MISKKRYLGVIFCILFLLIGIQQKAVSAVKCNPKYIPLGQLRNISGNDLALNISVEDIREDKEKFFFIWSFGSKHWDSDASKFNKNQSIILTRTPRDIVTDALIEAFFSAGHKITESKDNLKIKARLNKFRYTLDTWKTPNPFAEIGLNITISKDNKDVYSDSFFQFYDKPCDTFKQLQDAEPVLSRCLSRLVNKIVMDEKLNNVIAKAYGKSPPTVDKADNDEIQPEKVRVCHDLPRFFSPGFMRVFPFFRLHI